jgi:signal transduction histidine kinase
MRPHQTVADQPAELIDGGSVAAELHAERLAALGMMTAGLAHDLGNHLQVASAAIYLLEQQMANAGLAESRACAEGALEALRRANALSRRIIGFSRDDDGVDCVDIDETLSAMRDALSWTVGPAMRLHLDLDGGSTPVRCDIREFENAILNLVANARDASPDGGLIAIAVRNDPRSRSVLVAVRDQGCGMAPESARRAFEPFFTTKSSRNGAGLGLALVADFARRAGGEASVESAPGAGTIVVLRLPAAPPSQPGLS